MGNYNWIEKESKKWNTTRMFFNDKKGIDNTCYMVIFGDLINRMEEFGFKVKPFEFISGIPNLRVDLEDKLSDSNIWSDLTKSLRSSNTSNSTTSIGRFGVSPESLKRHGYNIFLNLTPQFIKAIQERNENFLIADVSVRMGTDVYNDFWFDYTV